MRTPVCFQVPDLTKRDVEAIQALGKGEAEPWQQALALKAICNKFSRPQDLLFVPGEADQTVFMNGRAFVGMQIYKTLGIKVGQMNEEEENG